VCCLFPVVLGILAIVFGVQGRKKAEANLATNGGMATAGMILGIVGVAMSVLYWIYSLIAGATS
jgi:hypothetical protein